VLFLQDTLFACPVCFQVEQSPTTEGLHAAVLVLLLVTVTVLAAFAVFVARFARRMTAAPR
jgi:hypothetical protein